MILLLVLLPSTTVLGLAVLRYRHICKLDAQRVKGAEARIQQAATDLDDWLAREEPLEEFKVWKRPVAQTKGGVER